ncbi:MAG: AsmA family protein, partial [Verrucomicrobium sp.]|nr:AsmA family protein [Verrucomicrobium sp.]
MSSASARTPRRLPLIVGGLVASLLVLYFVLTSGMFLKAVVLPKVSDAVGATITADDISLSPFSGIDLTRLKVTPTGASPLAAIEKVRVRYDLRAILGGTIDVSEVTIENPVLTLEQRADGSMNLPKTSGKAPEASPQPAAASKAPQLRIRNVSVKDGSFRMVSTVAGGGRQQVE